MIGREPLSVTSHLDIDFLRKPAAADVIAHTTLHKLGKRLAVGDVLMSPTARNALRPSASVTYTIPVRPACASTHRATHGREPEPSELSQLAGTLGS